MQIYERPRPPSPPRTFHREKRRHKLAVRALGRLFQTARVRVPLKLLVNYGLKTIFAKVPANSLGPIPWTDGDE